MLRRIASSVVSSIVVTGAEQPSALRMNRPAIRWSTVAVSVPIMFCIRSNRSLEMKRQTACKPGSVPARRGAGMAIHLGRPLPDASRDRPERRRGRPARHGRSRACRSLLGLAPGGVFPAAAVAGGAVRSYRTISPLPPMPSHRDDGLGGMFSVALSLGSPPPGVTRHRVSVEPGLSSLPLQRRAAIRPSGMG